MDLQRRIDVIEEELAQNAGTQINLNSPKQVGWLLFEKLGLPPLKKTKTGYSSDVSVLQCSRLARVATFLRCCSNIEN
jgi:DNA polymerase-1